MVNTSEKDNRKCNKYSTTYCNFCLPCGLIVYLLQQCY